MLLAPAASRVAPTSFLLSLRNLYEAHIFCHYSGGQFRVLVTDHAGQRQHGHAHVRGDAGRGGCMLNQQTCEEPPTPGSSWCSETSPGSPNVPWGTVCLDTDTANEFDVITPGKVFMEMRKLAWPEAKLVIQPPDGRTLVNLETNFLTTTTEPTTQTIQLLGHGVEIEATPVTYTVALRRRRRAQRATRERVPDLRITHVYEKADVTVSPSVDVTYQGRYRVDGGEWRDIPEDLTVAGTPADLQVLTATHPGYGLSTVAGRGPQAGRRSGTAGWSARISQPSGSRDIEARVRRPARTASGSARSPARATSGMRVAGRRCRGRRRWVR